MLAVKILTLSRDGDVDRGSITLAGGQVHAPDGTLFENILAKPIRLPWDDPVNGASPESDPETWLRNLWQMYRGSYVRATKAEEV
jgi:hypothetical protein